MENGTKVIVTTPKHDKPYGTSPVEVMAMLDMHQHWNNNPSQRVVIAPTTDGSDLFIYVNPRDREWSSMNESSFMLVRMPNGLLAPLMIS